MKPRVKPKGDRFVISIQFKKRLFWIKKERIKLMLINIINIREVDLTIVTSSWVSHFVRVVRVDRRRRPPTGTLVSPTACLELHPQSNVTQPVVTTVSSEPPARCNESCLSLSLLCTHDLDRFAIQHISEALVKYNIYGRKSDIL